MKRRKRTPDPNEALPCDEQIKILKAQLQEHKTAADRAIKQLHERCDRCSVRGVTSYCSRCEITKALELLTDNTK